MQSKEFEIPLSDCVFQSYERSLKDTLGLFFCSRKKSHNSRCVEKRQKSPKTEKLFFLSLTDPRDFSTIHQN